MRQSNVQFLAKTAVLGTAVAGVMMLSGCSKQEDTTTLNIGFQKYGVLPILKERGTLEASLKNKA